MIIFSREPARGLVFKHDGDELLVINTEDGLLGLAAKIGLSGGKVKLKTSIGVVRLSSAQTAEVMEAVGMHYRQMVLLRLAEEKAAQGSAF